LLISSLVVLGVIATSPAQCTTAPLPGNAVPGVSGNVYTCLRWDPDGAGPLPAQLIVGGSFAIAGDAFRANIAAVDPTTGVWSSLGSGVDSTVFALTTLSTGELVAAGSFLQAGGVPANRVARWNGTSWSPLGSGCGGAVRALVAGDNGSLFAAGDFFSAGGSPAWRIAQWDGTSWLPCGSGLDS
jgi:hypothetical protein